MCCVFSCSVVLDSLQPHGMQPTRLLCPWGSSKARILQEILSTQGLNPGPPHCTLMLYCLSHQEAQEHWSGQPIPSLADLPNTGIELGFPAWQADSLPAKLPAYRMLGLNSVMNRNRLTDTESQFMIIKEKRRSRDKLKSLGLTDTHYYM